MGDRPFFDGRRTISGSRLLSGARCCRCVVQAVLGGLAEYAGFGGEAVVGGEHLDVDLIGHLHPAHGLGAQDLHTQYIRVGHTAVIQLVVLADEGLAFISQFGCKWHRESLPIV